MTKDRLIGAISLAIGAVTLFLTTQITLKGSGVANGDPGPKLFPMIAGIIFIFCGLGLIFKKQEEAKEFLNKEQTKRLGELFLVFILDGVGLNFLGFIISTPIILFIMMMMFAGEKKIPLWGKLVYSIGITVICYVLFSVCFKTVLPAGVLLKAFM